MADQPPPPPDSGDFKERRQHPRFRPLAQVEFSGGGEVAVLPIVDISRGGICLEMNENELIGLEVDEPVAVFLDGRGANGPVYVNVPAVVIRIKRGPNSSVALEWRDLGDDNQARFNEVLSILERAAAP